MGDTFEKYGFVFTRVNEDNLELMRNWRNSDFVRNGMLYREYITPEMQLNWFHKINNDKNYYYLVQLNGEYVGVSNVKDVENGAGEAGFFLVDPKFEGTEITALVGIAFGDFIFNVLNIEKEYIHVRKDNPEALKLNLFCGFKIIEEQSGDDFYYLELTKEEMLKNDKLNKLKKYINKK